MDREHLPQVIRVAVAAPFAEILSINDCVADYPDEIEVCATVSNLDGLVEQLRAIQPAVLLLSDGLGIDPLHAIAGLRAVSPATRLVVMVRDGRSEGALIADAVVSSDVPAAQLRDAIVAVSRAPAAAGSERAPRFETAGDAAPASPSLAGADPDERGAEPREPHGRIVCVFSGKGGVGTSVVAANVATALAVGGSRVAMVDLDLQYGDLSLLLHLESHPVSIDLLAHSDGHIDAKAVESAMATSDAGVRLLLAPSSPDSGDLVTPAVLDAILLHLARVYDYLVIDSPAHLDERVVAVMELAAHILLVSSPGLTSVKATKVTLKLLQALGIARDHVALVLNQPRPRVSLPAGEIEKALRFPVLAALPFEPRMEEAIDAGRPLILTEPRGAFSQRVKLIVAHVERAGNGGTGRLHRPAALWRLRFGR